MGGNARAIDMNTGDVLKIGSREAYAEQVNLKEIDIVQFRKDIENAFHVIDSHVHLKTGMFLWGELKREVFLGSAALLWEDEFVPRLLFVKPTLGDIDVAVPEDRLQDLFDVLATIQDKNLGRNVVYVGQNRLKLRKPQINAVFLWNETFVQVDFVGLPFNSDDTPDEFVRFARSSPHEDIIKGLKGVAHKYLLMTLAWVTSHREDIAVLTDKSPLPPERVRFKTMHEPPRFYSFSIDRGYRCRLKQCARPGGGFHRLDGKTLCKEVPTSESTYVTKPSEIFESVFGKKPSSRDMDDFGSYQGLIRLSTKYLGENATLLALDQMIRFKLYGPGQAMSRDSAEADKSIKQRIIDVAKEMFPALKTLDAMIKTQQDEYYSRYHEREVEE